MFCNSKRVSWYDCKDTMLVFWGSEITCQNNLLLADVGVLVSFYFFTFPFQLVYMHLKWGLRVFPDWDIYKNLSWYRSFFSDCVVDSIHGCAHVSCLHCLRCGCFSMWLLPSMSISEVPCPTICACLASFFMWAFLLIGCYIFCSTLNKHGVFRHQ